MAKCANAQMLVRILDKILKTSFVLVHPDTSIHIRSLQILHKKRILHHQLRDNKTFTSWRERYKVNVRIKETDAGYSERNSVFRVREGSVTVVCMGLSLTEALRVHWESRVCASGLGYSATQRQSCFILLLRHSFSACLLHCPWDLTQATIPDLFLPGYGTRLYILWMCILNSDVSMDLSEEGL